MTQAILYIVVFSGFSLGSAIAGEFGSFIGGLSTFAACLVGIDVLQAKRGLDGFFLRHRGDLLEFNAVIVGIIVGGNFANGFFGIVGGILAGVFVGQWLSNSLGWGGETQEQEVRARLAYLAVLNAIATLDGNPSQHEQKELRVSARRLFAALGYGAEHDVTNMLAHAQQITPEIELPSFVSQLPRDQQLLLLLDTLRIIYSKRPVSSQKRQTLSALFDWTGMQDRSPLIAYDRDAVQTPEMRWTWLDELGLPPSATDEEIDSAYRNVARKYHPDRLQDLPPEMVKLASAKLAAANAAYHRLKDKPGPSEFRFWAELTDEIVFPIDGCQLTCRCWLCARKNHVPADADFGTARCGQCHALLGASQDAV